MAELLNIQFSFTWPGFWTVLLPLIPNLFWAVIPSHYRREAKLHCGKIWENLESAARILVVVGFLLFSGPHFKSYLLPVIAGFFLLLYYLRWLRYFIRRCDPEVLRKPMLGLPAPMAVLPVLYFLLMALWLHNLPSLILLLLFGVCHIHNSIALKV